MSLLLVGIPVLSMAGFVLVVLGTIKKKGSWGINLGRRICPGCGGALPAIRKPANLSQAMWGGSTCLKCGVESDKWGNRVNG